MAPSGPINLEKVEGLGFGVEGSLKSRVCKTFDFRSIPKLHEL